MLTLAAVFAAGGVLGDMLALPDGLMLVLWVAGGTLYYQLMRRPRVVVELIRAVGATSASRPPVAGSATPVRRDQG
jgi:hypothetical protein